MQQYEKEYDALNSTLKQMTLIDNQIFQQYISKLEQSIASYKNNVIQLMNRKKSELKFQLELKNQFINQDRRQKNKVYNKMRTYTEGDYQWDHRKFLGEGSFGKVYKGINIKTKQEVAVKVLDMKNFKNKDMITSLKNEIQIMKQLKSPNVVHLLDCSGNNKETYIFMEFCEGGDLGHFMDKQGGKLKEKTALDIINQVMNGFKELFEKQYIHRDVKPQNILMHKDIFKIADFGFATKVDIRGKQFLKEYVGTPLYMAPQLLENHPYTSKSDVWSIGMTFYEMIFGKTPWPARDIYSFLKNIKTTPLRFPYDKPIGKQTKDFISKCLVIDENKRMGWEEVFKHPILQQGAGEIQQPEVQIDEKNKKILRQMQEIVQSHNLNVHHLFDKFDQDKGGTLDEQEFFQFLVSIDPRITSFEAKSIFRIVDTSNDRKISLQEFATIFCQYDFADIDDPAQNLITDLKEIIKANQLNIKQIFANFDKDKLGTLDKLEFEKLIRVVAPGLKNHEIQKCFEKFDKDKDNQISFDEFKNALTYGIQDQDNNYNFFKEKAKRLISELRRIIKENNIDIKLIFRNFDQTKDSYLDFNEFKKLIKIIDKCIYDDEYKYIFKLFDSDNDDKISFQEFSKFFN